MFAKKLYDHLLPNGYLRMVFVPWVHSRARTDDLMVTLGGTYVTSGWGSGWGANLEGFWA